jgi:hypothetical protein
MAKAEVEAEAEFSSSEHRLDAVPADPQADVADPLDRRWRE